MRGKSSSGISVVIPTYNGAAWIAETLESVFSQTRLPIEVIVVDDGSTDDTMKLVERMAVKAPVSVDLLRVETNSGSPTPTLNCGIARARGEFIAIIDQDDVFLPTKLEQQARVLAANPEMSFVFSFFGRYHFGSSLRNLAVARLRARRIQRRMKSRNGIFVCEGAIVFEELARTSTNFFGGYPGFLFRRSAWALKGGLDERLVIAADFEFLCWLCAQGTVGLIPEIHYWRREHGANLTARTGIRWRLDVINVLLSYADFPDAPETAREVRNCIRHHLWEVARRLASSGHRQAARNVSRTIGRMAGASWRAGAQQLAVPAYVAYRRLIGRPWIIPTEQVDEAMVLAKVVAGCETERDECK